VSSANSGIIEFKVGVFAYNPVHVGNAPAHRYSLRAGVHQFSYYVDYAYAHSAAIWLRISSMRAGAYWSPRISVGRYAYIYVARAFVPGGRAEGLVFHESISVPRAQVRGF